MNKKILVIAAHPDDEILGIGGTVAKHILEGDECFTLILGEGITSRYEKPDLSDNNKVNELHNATFKAAKNIGYKEVYLEKLPDNRFDSVDLLDIIKLIEMYIDKIKPDIIYTHHGGDMNIDHRKTYEAVLTATRPIGENYVNEIYCFETISSTEWNFEYVNTFRPNYFVDITSTLDKKLEAIKFYEGEMREFPHPRSIKNLISTAEKWGSIISVNYAEAFEVVRIIRK